MPKQITIVLNETEYTITEKGSRENAKWRQELGGPFAQLVDLLEMGPNVELTDMASLANLVRSVSGLLLNSVDMITDLVRSYAPNLPEEAFAFDSEILEVFTEVLSLAYPFGSLVNKIRGLSGRQTAPS